MRLRFMLPVLAVLAGASAPAFADIVYTVQSTNFNDAAVDFSFTEPTFLTATTTLSASELTFGTDPTTCSIASFTLSSPLSASPGYSFTYGGSCGVIGGGGVVPGPLDQDGVYDNHAPLPTIFTLTGTPTVANVTPEPSALTLLATGLLSITGLVRRRVA